VISNHSRRIVQQRTNIVGFCYIQLFYAIRYDRIVIFLRPHEFTTSTPATGIWLIDSSSSPKFHDAMLMTIRSNGVFPDQNNTQYNSFPTQSGQIAETVVQYTDEPTQTNSPRLPSAAQYNSPSRGNVPQPVMYVRALYDYEADDRTSLSFHEGDIIQVITQLESGWWDGVINGVRGWFPSNYCQAIASSEDMLEGTQNGAPQNTEEEDTDEQEDQDEYEDEYEEDDGDSEQDDIMHLPTGGMNNIERTRADFWIPQATPDGRLFYFNTETGESSMELPLESPSSANENGPRNRMNVNIPEKTRPPPEMMARGYTQDEDNESDGNSASEMEGESIMLASRSSYVVSNFAPHSLTSFNRYLA